MLVCRKGSKRDSTPQPETPRRRRGNGSRKLGEGGPVFLPRRKPSPLAQALLVEADRVTAYDDQWFAGRPSV